MIDLTTGWVQHPGVPGGYHLVYVDSLVGEISIVTGPRGSGLMAANDPGQETTYEVWFPGLADPTGHLTLDEIKGIIKYLRQREEEFIFTAYSNACSECDDN
jgi:hypothetical protein